MADTRLMRYSPVNWLIVDWSFNGQQFNDCGLPRPYTQCEIGRESVDCKQCLPIQEAINTYDWERFLPEIMVGIEDADEDIAANYAREAAIDFCKRARVLQRQVAIPIECDKTSYQVYPYDDENIIGVMGVQVVDGCCNKVVADEMDLSFYFDAERQTVTFEYLPDCGTVYLWVWSAPTEDACAYDTFLYDNFRREITLMARRNYILAVHFRDTVLVQVIPSQSEYERAVLLAKRRATTNPTATRRNKPSGLWSRRGRGYF